MAMIPLASASKNLRVRSRDEDFDDPDVRPLQRARPDDPIAAASAVATIDILRPDTELRVPVRDTIQPNELVVGVIEPGETIAATLRDAYAFCAIALRGDGRTIVGIKHVPLSSAAALGEEADSAVNDILQAMTDAGAGDRYTLVLIGGRNELAELELVTSGGDDLDNAVLDVLGPHDDCDAVGVYVTPTGVVCVPLRRAAPGGMAGSAPPDIAQRRV